jgi:hypothetical protein
MTGGISRARVAVLGYIVRGPLGGLAWHHLQYVIGLERLGYDVAFIEDSGDDDWSCYDPSRGITDTDPTYGLAWTGKLLGAHGLGERWAYFDKHRSTWLGPMAGTAEEFCTTADVVLNLSGSNLLRPWSLRAPVRAFVDTDPVFTQVQNLTKDDRRALAESHNAFLTFGESFGPASEIPDDGFPWRPTRQPVVLDLWGPVEAPPSGPYTTVMQWASYPAVEYGGRRFGMKSDSFAEFMTLPSEVPVRLEIAAGGGAPWDELRSFGWSIVDPLEVTRDAWAFRRYVQLSRGEYSVAKHGYVTSRSGWFSERSANYLATGRPVVTQETGFGEHIPTGKGLMAFSTLEEAATAIRAVERDYRQHSVAAREIAEDYFESNRVLLGLLETLRS